MRAATSSLARNARMDLSEAKLSYIGLAARRPHPSASDFLTGLSGGTHPASLARIRCLSGPMGLFGNRSRRSEGMFPPTLRHDLEMYGRFEFDPAGGIESDRIYLHLLAPYLETAQADPVGFTAALARLALPIGGWTVYGAAHLIVDLIGDVDDENYLAMQDAAIEWVLSQGHSRLRLTGYENARLAATHARRAQ